MKTVLVVEDDPRIAQIVQDYLQHAGFAVLMSGDGAGALALTRDRRPDLVVLDLGLPGLDGIEVAKSLRRESQVPLIMLTARVEESDRLLGLEVGADDYITKPFSPRELVARVRAVLRRADHAGTGGAPGNNDTNDDDVLRRADLVIDRGKLIITRAGVTLDLTVTEFELTAALARRPGRVFTRAQLLDAVRGTEVESFERAIDAHVKNIRRKLEPEPRRPRYILTVYGMGYKFTES